jgi:hypothetical protein
VRFSRPVIPHRSTAVISARFCAVLYVADQNRATSCDFLIDSRLKRLWIVTVITPWLRASARTTLGPAISGWSCSRDCSGESSCGVGRAGK